MTIENTTISRITDVSTLPDNVTITVVASKLVAQGTCPIGTVLPWLKTFTNTPALPSGWVECAGQTLSDAASVYNGQVIPNLNGASAQTQRFLRGSTTSGTTGGEDTHALSVAELASHTHTINSGTTGSGLAIVHAALTTSTTETTNSQGSGTAHENRPSFYEVVYIMRVK